MLGDLFFEQIHKLPQRERNDKHLFLHISGTKLRDISCIDEMSMQPNRRTHEVKNKSNLLNKCFEY